MRIASRRRDTRRPLMLFASELAACIGRNKYQDVRAAMLKVWARADGESYELAQARNAVTIKDARRKVQELGVDVSGAVASRLPPDAEIRKVLDRPLVEAVPERVERARVVLSTPSGDPEERREKLIDLCTPEDVSSRARGRVSRAVDAVLRDAASGKDATGSIEAAIETSSVGDRPDARKAVEEVVFTSRGTAGETAAIEAFEARTGATVRSRNDVFYRCTVTCPEDEMRGVDRRDDVYEVDDDIRELVSVSLGGRVDGLTDDGRKVVETKCRQRHFFHRLPDYEAVQMQASMFLTGAARCDLVQKLGGDIRVNEYAFDEGAWREICTSAVLFAQQMQMVLRHDWIQDDVLSRSA